MIIKDPNYYRKPNLALDHLITFILDIKYTFSSHTHIPFIIKSFHIFYGLKRYSTQCAIWAKEEEK